MVDSVDFAVLVAEVADVCGVIALHTGLVGGVALNAGDLNALDLFPAALLGQLGSSLAAQLAGGLVAGTDEGQDLSLSAALRNVGAQVSAYEGHRTARLPLSLDLGFSQGMAHLPVRVHATLTDLTRWRTSDFVLPAGETSAPSFGRKLLNHLSLGLDILPSESVWLAVGYNFRRAWELKAVESAHMAGLSAGAGLQLERFQLSLSYARFHQAASSLMVSAGYSL